ncbi:hypothetical protein TNCV_1681291 [Trichonephila clavipes]|nr:hypothetical protein TNCV_1681291 [Trichonephila clavipes]
MDMESTVGASFRRHNVPFGQLDLPYINLDKYRWGGEGVLIMSRRHQSNYAKYIQGHEDSPRQHKIICSTQTLPRSSIYAQTHLGMPSRRNKVTKNGNGPSEGSLRELLYSPNAPRIAEAVIKTFDGI